MTRTALLIGMAALCGCGQTEVAPTPAPASPAKIRVLYFTQANCPACRMLEKDMAQPEVLAEMADIDLRCVVYPNARFDLYEVRQTPTLVALLGAASKERRCHGGSAEILRAWLHDLRYRREAASAGISTPLESVSLGAISEGGPVAPDGKTPVVCDLPASERKKNIASKGLGCCVPRSIEYAARWQQVPELFDLPEQMVKAGIEGGGYPAKVDRLFARFAPHVQYINDTSGDPAILEAILATGRMPCVTYNGRDCHYRSTIAHMVCLPYFSRATGLACVSDNNFIAADQFVWMTSAEFLDRWRGSGGGWCVALLEPPPPKVPHNRD